MENHCLAACAVTPVFRSDPKPHQWFCMAAGSGICFSVRPAVRNLYPKKDSARFQKGSLVLDTSSLYLAGSLFLRPQTYLYDRLLTALGLQHTDDGPGFTRLALQYEQTRFSLFGGSSVSDRLPREELYSTYLLHSIFLWFGIAAGILIIAALAFFALYSMHCALRQSNRLAMLLGTAASGVLLLELFNYVLTNFGINLFYTASVPFLSYGLTGTVANSILVGILLGIIRNRNVLYEKESGPAVIPDTGTV